MINKIQFFIKDKIIYIFVLLVLVNSYIFGSVDFLVNDNMQVFFLDVGQGDSILIKTPDEKLILVDSGPDIRVLSKLSEVLPFWVRKIDLIILTHPDLDHVGGFPEVLRNYDIGGVVFNNFEHDNSAYNEFKRLLEEHGISNLNYYDNHYFRSGCCVYINFIFPLHKKDLAGGDPNDNSIAFELIHKDINFFFGGDLGKEIEDEIARTDSFLDVDILKLGHHGSKTSTSDAFVTSISPEVSIVSAGKDNRFGHPHQEVLEILEDNYVKVYNTASEGTILVESDGENYYVK